MGDEPTTKASTAMQDLLPFIFSIDAVDSAATLASQTRKNANLLQSTIALQTV